MLQATVRFLTDLGTEVHIPVELPSADPFKVEDAILTCQRQYGRKGWRPGEIPPGGYYFPLANEEDFDWSLVGGFRTTRERDGKTEDGVYHGGQFYLRRPLAAVESRKMTLPEAVKYSRGARPTDPEAIREVGDGDIPYVTLAWFRGAGKKREKFAIPGDATRPANNDALHPQAAPAPPSIVEPEENSTDSLADTPETREALKSFVRDTGEAIDKQTASITVGGRERNLASFVRQHWVQIQDDFPMLVNVVRAMETASGRKFQIPLAV